MEQRLAREAEERAFWERLAAEYESKTLEITARLSALRADAEQAPRMESLELIQRGEDAASKLDLDEADTRALIDQQLRDSGWEADTTQMRYGAGARPAKGRNIAIAEWATASGPADYALFAGLTLLGVVEAKRRRKNVSAAIDQAERYSVGMDASPDFAFAGGHGQSIKHRSYSPPTAAPISNSLKPKAASGFATRAGPPTTGARW